MNATIEHSTASHDKQEPSKGPLGKELEFLWKDGGQTGKAYDLYLGRISRNPVVRSHVTGKYFMLPWWEIIELAVKNGLDEK
jgi:hypothetical protein